MLRRDYGDVAIAAEQTILSNKGAMMAGDVLLELISSGCRLNGF